MYHFIKKDIECRYKLNLFVIKKLFTLFYYLY